MAPVMASSPEDTPDEDTPAPPVRCFSILELINQLILIKRMYARTGAHAHGVLELVIRTGLCNIRPV